MFDTNSITRNSGFTLVEAIVTSTLLGIMAIIVYTIFQMNSAQVKDCTLVARLQGQYEAVVSQIGAKTRVANVVQVTGTTWPSTDIATTTTNSIQMKDTLGNTLWGYRVTGTSLEEDSAGAGTWKIFKVGSLSVRCIAGVNPFQLSNNRKTLMLNLSLVDTFQNLPGTMSSRGEVFQCRN